jgi:hypothetical protein
MSEQRQVWIVGEIESGARAGDQRFHTAYCYVLDQMSNRDRRQKVSLGDLPATFKPCQICAPGGRRSGSEPTPPPAPAEDVIRPGDTVQAEDEETGEPLNISIAPRAGSAAPGHVSPDSPIAGALIGRRVSDPVDVKPPSGKTRRLKILGFDRPS